MIDIHSHILFDIDDGANNIDESIEMCRDGYENGYRVITATPHFYKYKNIDDFIYERNEKIEQLENALEIENIPLRIASGAELYLTDEVLHAGDLDELTIHGSRYMLCEFPLGPFDIKRAPIWIDELISRGYVPIIAHPERYYEFHKNLPVINEFLRRDVLFQVNIDSVIGNNGERAQGLGIDMLVRGFAQFLGSDAHETHHRHTRIEEKLSSVPDIITPDILKKTLSINPRKILRNEDI